MQICRGLAVLIAIAAVIDPAIRSPRRGRAIVSVVATNPTRDSAFLIEVIRRLDRRYTVLPAAFPAAEASIVVGSELPPNAHDVAAPAMVIASRIREPDIEFERVETPNRVDADSRVAIAVTVATHRRDADSVNVELVDGTVVVARERRALRPDSAITAVASFVPTRAVPTVVQVRAFLNGSADTVRHDLLIDMRPTRWSVLFFDRRPSWTSTFVRRALERDPRFFVTSRIVTSTNISRETGSSPQQLAEIAQDARYDVVVIGSPDVLSPRDIVGVESLLESRGTSVLVLPDHAAQSPFDTWMGIGRWTTTNRGSTVDIRSPAFAMWSLDPVRLRGVSIGVPQRLPDNAEVIAEIPAADAGQGLRTRRGEPVVWRVRVGLGTLIVSGAFDAWRYRDPSQSAFDASWRDIMLDAASRRQPFMEVRVTPNIVAPRQPLDIVATFRSGGDGDSATVEWQSQSDSLSTAIVPLMYAPSSGQRVGRVRAPLAPGAYTMRMVRGIDTAQTPFVVSARIARDLGSAPALLEAWSASRRGRVVPREHLDSVPAILEQIMRATPQMATWHPMRSPWWIVPFALLLSCEWWLRRRRGLP